MTDYPEIRERRYKLELFELDDNLEKKSKSKSLCELVSFSATFSLNTIPTAQVVPSTGLEIMYGGRTVDYKKLQQLAIDSKPVGVYLTVLHSFRSSNNKNDKQYWPKDTCCIFKGYLQPPVFEITAFGAGRKITILHWLTALERISLITTASYVGNPIEITVQGYGLGSDSKDGVWFPLLNSNVALDNIWEEGIKPLYLELLKWGEEYKDKYNPFVKDQRNRLRTVINKITQEISVDELLNESTYLQELIAADIQSDPMMAFIQMDGWSKLITDYCPSYLMALVPQVDKATLIPAPCTINKKEAIEISLDEIFTITAAPFLTKKISRMNCVAAEAPVGNNTAIGPAHYVSLGTYPPDKVQKEGLNVTIGFPSWITAEAVGELPQATETLDFFTEPEEAVEKVKEQKEILEEVNQLQNTVGQRYTQVAYLTQAFNGAFVRIAMPVNMCICPGAMVKINLDSKGDAAYYGTIANVEVNLASGNTAHTTVLTIVNIRDSVSIDDKIDNPQEKVGFYTKQWSGNGVTLYAEEGKKKKDKEKSEDQEVFDKLIDWAKEKL